MAISIVDMLMVYSGTTTNVPLSSIGGAISIEANKEVRGQTGAGMVNITGVTILDAYGNLEGVGTLGYTLATETLYWVPPGAAFGAGKAIIADGVYTIGNAAGYVIVDCVYASMPSGNAEDTINIANVAENIFDNVPESQSFAGNTEYRCFYAVNNHATDIAYNVTLCVGAQPDAVDTVSLALDAAGNNGTAVGPLADTEDTTNLLSGLTFTSPISAAAGLVLGTMVAGDEYPFWVKKVTPGGNRISAVDNTFALGLYISSS